MYKVAVMLLGKLYERYRNAICLEEGKGNIEVVAIGVPDPYASSLDGWPMVDVDTVLRSGWDYLIVSQPVKETAVMAKTFAKIGINPERVLSIEVFGAICFDFSAYVKLHDQKVSIIASNCWGGFTYHALKMRFGSPFVNMFLEDADYLKLLSDLPGYLKEPLVQDCSSEAATYDYPIGLLKDVRLHMNHYSDFETARAKWEERCERINYDNLFFMMFTCDPLVARAFAALPYPRKIVFAPGDYQVPCQINLERFNGLIDQDMSQFFKSVNSVSNGALQFYDPIRLLNGDEDFYRV